MKTFISLSTAVLALAVSGCRVASPNISPHAGPASASAAESPLPPAAPLLMSGTNYALAPEAEPQQNSQPDHSQHQRQKSPETPAAQDQAPAKPHENHKP